MRTVQFPEPGVVEVNWQWLPTFLGINQTLQKEIVDAITPEVVGMPWDEACLDRAHDLVVDFLVAKFPSIEGLRDHLDGLKFVRYRSDDEQNKTR